MSLTMILNDLYVAADLNIDLQTELDRLQKQLASATETKQASQEQAARLKTDIDTAQARADAAETELRATQLIIVSLQQARKPPVAFECVDCIAQIKETLMLLAYLYFHHPLPYARHITRVCLRTALS